MVDDREGSGLGRAPLSWHGDDPGMPSGSEVAGSQGFGDMDDEGTPSWQRAIMVRHTKNLSGALACALPLLGGTVISQASVVLRHFMPQSSCGSPLYELLRWRHIAIWE